MALNTHDAETEALVEALARLAGETRAQAMTVALQQRLRHIERRRRAGLSLADELDEIALRCAVLPVLDDRTADAIVAYDERGLPR